MKVTYGEIVINVKAEETDINGPDEMELSDQFYYLAEEIEKFLNVAIKRYPMFNAVVREE